MRTEEKRIHPLAPRAVGVFPWSSIALALQDTAPTTFLSGQGCNIVAHFAICKHCLVRGDTAS